MISKSFDEKDFEKYTGQTMYGRIKEYSHSRGYGFIFTEEGKDLFVSSYELGKLEDKISVGTTVRFTPKQWKERYVASDITIVENVGYNEVIKCPNGIKIKPRNLEKIGYIPGGFSIKKMDITAEELLQHGYSLKDLDYVFFRTQKGLEYRFFREGSPVKGDGSIPDLKAFYRELEERYYKLY